MPQSPAISKDGYSQLLNRVKKVLIEGQARIEAERVRTYWETGRIIHTDILKNKDRAEYGKDVVERLCRDLGIEISLLQRCVQFAKTYPRLKNSVARRNFTWTHYRKLITVADDKLRARLEKEALAKEWSSEELASRIQRSRPRERSDNGFQTTSHEQRVTSDKLSVPKVGSLYTYATFTPPEVFAVKNEVMVDCGFDVWHSVHPRDWPGAQFKKVPDFTYRAAVERVIDGDTLWVNIDLGFKIVTRQKLRLKGIDTPELSTQAGQRAKSFVQRQLRGVDFITLVSSKSDKYDRYLADVFIEEEYLNQKLLDEGLAEIWKE